MANTVRINFDFDANGQLNTSLFPASTPPADFNADTTNNINLNNSFNYRVTAVDTFSGDVTIILPGTAVDDGFTATFYHLPGSANKITIDATTNGQTLRARGLDVINPDASVTIMYDAGTSTWYGIGDLV